MLLIVMTPLALLTGLALGGRLDRLANQPLRFGWLAIAVFALQWLLIHISGSQPDPLLGLALSGSAALLLAVLLPNWNLPGFKLLLAGALLNLVVMAANGGFMPITPQTIQATGREVPAIPLGERIPLSKNILLTAEQARLSWLGDSIIVGWPVGFAVSPGDVLLACGIAWFVLAGTEPRRLILRRT